MFSFISQLEARIASRAESLEEVHLCAAIDAQLTNVLPSKTNANPSTMVTHGKVEDSTNNDQGVIFDDYINPNSVRNCFSPFVPTSSDRIQAFIELTQLKPQDNVLDLGCGDGRVCISVTKTIGCRAIGVDVSPPCIAMARNLAQEENICETKCAFFEADATVSPDILLSEASPLSAVLKSSTVIFLFIYPDLLIRLLPFLSKVTDGINGSTRVVATLTYHIPESNAVVECIDEVHDIKLYSKVFV